MSAIVPMMRGVMPTVMNDSSMCPSKVCINSWQRHFVYPKQNIRICTTCGYVSLVTDRRPTA